LADAQALDETELEKKLYPPMSGSRPPIPSPDWPALYLDYRNDKDLTLQGLWEEYREHHPQGLGRTQFCEGFRRYVKTLRTSMRQDHRAGEKAFVDYAGRTIPIQVGQGETRQASVFVGVLGASNYTFAEATWTQGLPDWLASHVRMFEFFGGVPKIVVPDNLKAGITSPCRYDPDRNRSYADLAHHYQVAVIPARVRRPRDKAKAEIAVQIVQRWILARLRKRVFFCLEEANTAIRELLVSLNDRPLKRFPATRRQLFERLDRPTLQRLPDVPYEFARWHQDTVGPEYLVEAFRNHYSVPHSLVGQKVDIRATTTTIEVFFNGNRVASHHRLSGEGKVSRVACHMPPNHRAWAERSPDTLRDWAREHGVGLAQVVEKILARADHPEVVLRQAEGVRSLCRQYGVENVEEASLLALQTGRPTYRFLKSLLSHQSGKHSLPASGRGLGIHHENVRGPGFFSGEGQPC
jgi:transposase